MILTLTLGEQGALLLIFLVNVGVVTYGIYLSWQGPGMVRGISLSILIRSAILVYALLITMEWSIALSLLLYVYIIGALLEYIGLRSGFPFGSYRYSKLLQPQIAGLPLQIIFEWALVAIPTWALLNLLNLPIVLFCVASALVIMGWDLFYDHIFVAMGFWHWKKGGPHLSGIPLSNYAGWFITGLLLSSGASLLFPLSQLNQTPLLVAMFLLMYLMQIVLQCFISKLRSWVAYLLGIIIVGWPIPLLLAANL